MFHRFSRKPTAADNRMAALDSLHASVMLADPDLNITYLNESARGLLQEAEAELRRELPRFEMAKLIGSNIDIFHKQPSHQRNMLAAMSKPHQATIVVGARTFDLLVTPLLEGGERVGFAVEWTDARERLLNLDLASQLEALNRSHAVISFTPDGIIQDANANFLGCMGYTLEEVRGKPHSIFVDPTTRENPAYAAFWDSLRRGEYQAAQYRRIGKGGRDVWIEGAYNPIRDRSGKVVKVVKFATDVTAQAKLLEDLKHNLGEIDGAIELSTDGTQAAATAAEETSANVQTVAASAEELAASIDEISASMARSRAATDSAFDRTVAVSRNTDQLSGAAQAMGGIVGLIRNIASQINLLALNATIEAARAGDAGKGFAVVASEVKSLAVQAARATEQISGEIDGIQGISLEVASALGAIREAVTTVRESVTLTASAVEEQSAVTRGMSASMQTAAGAVTTISANVNSIAAAVLQAGQAVSKTKEAAQVLAR